MFIGVYVTPEQYDKYLQSREWVVVWVGAISTLQALTWLTTHWSVAMKTAFTSWKADNPRTAKLIKIQPIANSGSAEVVPIKHDQVS